MTAVRMNGILRVDPESFAPEFYIPVNYPRSHGIAWDNGAIWIVVGNSSGANEKPEDYRGGLAKYDATTGRLLISARRIAGNLHLTVRDDGSGLVSGGMSRENRGVGLANTSERLRQLYSDAASLEVVSADDGGTVARVVVPFRLAVAEWEGARGEGAVDS
jgi:hypothetical protein